MKTVAYLRVSTRSNIYFEGKQDLQTKVMIALFGLYAEVERDLISERTKEGLAAAARSTLASSTIRRSTHCRFLLTL